MYSEHKGKFVLIELQIKDEHFQGEVVGQLRDELVKTLDVPGAGCGYGGEVCHIEFFWRNECEDIETKLEKFCLKNRDRNPKITSNVHSFFAFH